MSLDDLLDTASYPENANRYRAFVQGFEDGCKSLAYRIEANHRLGVYYADGYRRGAEARGRAIEEATKMSGYEPTVLRGDKP